MSRGLSRLVMKGSTFEDPVMSIRNRARFVMSRDAGIGSIDGWTFQEAKELKLNE